MTGLEKGSRVASVSTPAVGPRLFQINVVNIQTLGRDFKRNKKNRGGTWRLRVLRPGRHLVLRFLFFVCVSVCLNNSLGDTDGKRPKQSKFTRGGF